MIGAKSLPSAPRPCNHITLAVAAVLGSLTMHGSKDISTGLDGNIKVAAVYTNCRELDIEGQIKFFFIFAFADGI